MQCFASLAAGEAEAAAADRTADMGICRAKIAMFVMRQRLIRAMRLFRQRMRNAMRQAAHLREQQGENQQESGEQRARHGAHFNQGG